MGRFRYSRWDGTQTGFDVDADSLLGELTDDLLYHGDLNAAWDRPIERPIHFVNMLYATADPNHPEQFPELLPADKARQIYEEIVRKMRDPALLEYAGRDLFKVRIFPIEPRSRKQVKISYTELLRSDTGAVTYTYPLSTEKFSARPIKSLSLKVELIKRCPNKQRIPIRRRNYVADAARRQAESRRGRAT